MKKIMFAILTVSILVTTLSAGSMLKEKPKLAKDPAKAEECRKSAEEYQRQQQNSEKEKDTTLAAALKKCADAKLKIAKGYETGDRNMVESGHYDYKKALFEKDEALQGEYLSDAKEAEAKGNKVLADIFKRLANAKMKMTQARKNGNDKALDAATGEFRKIWAEREKLFLEDLNKQLDKAEKADKKELTAALKKCIEIKQKLIKANETNNGKMIEEAQAEYKKALEEKDKAAKMSKAADAK